jgi:hypothetical protein
MIGCRVRDGSNALRDGFQNELFERLPVSFSILFYETDVGRIWGPWLDRPFLGPIPITTKQAPDQETSDMSVPIHIRMNAKKQIEYTTSKDYNLQDLLSARKLSVGNITVHVKDSEPLADDALHTAHTEMYRRRRRFVPDVGISCNPDMGMAETAIVLSPIVSCIVVLSGRSKLKEQSPMGRPRIDCNFHGVELASPQLDEKTSNLAS